MEESGVDSDDNTFEENDSAPGSSVFGDGQSHSSGSSVFGDEPADPEDGSDSPQQQSVFGDDGPQDDASALDADPWAAPETVSLDDWQATSDETIALDVDPEDPDDLDAWSGLAPSDTSDSLDPEALDADALADSWDPGPAPADDDTVSEAPVKPSERFFTYDDESVYVDDGFSGDEPSGGDRDMQSAAITGVALLAVALIAISIGPLVALGLIVVVVVLSAGEFFNALRVAGYQPATLLGLVASVSMPLAVYWRGQQAVALVLVLSVVFGLLWFLSGVATEMPVMNLGVTLLGIVYIGVLGSFGAAMLELSDRYGRPDEGTGLLLAAIVVTIGYDIGAFFAGRSFGRTPLTSISPNKTVEGLIGGAFASLIAAVVFFGIVRIADPWDVRGDFSDALLLGLVGAIVAPLGDLGESLIKRDLGIKDMGSVLPGHGGFLDRFDALLFVLPAVYFLAEALFYTTS